jgi:hypothetical protein
VASTIKEQARGEPSGAIPPFDVQPVEHLG